MTMLFVLYGWLLFRAIDRMVRSTAGGDVPVVLRPLKDRLGTTALESAGLVSERRRQRAQTVGSLLRSVTSLVIGVLALMLVLAEVGFQLGPFIAGAGIVGVALGFGAQNLVKDFLSGIFMLLEDQYGVGDVIAVGGISGTVEGVSLRLTRIRDVTGVVWHVRNGTIQQAGNESQGWARTVIDYPVSATRDVPQVRELMLATAIRMWQEPEWHGVILEEPQVWGVQAVSAGRSGASEPAINPSATSGAQRAAGLQRDIEATSLRP
jgi:small conductance mechanosensitive channel